MFIKAKINRQRLKIKATDLGAELFGVADVAGIKEKIELPKESLSNLNRAISLGVALCKETLDTIQEAPNKIYFHHYRTVNTFLDQLTFRLSNFIQRQGFKALAIPASLILDWEKQSSHLSHKKIALLAGLGWIGRNNLLVNKKFGSRFRLASILTDMPLAVDRPKKQDCGECRRCIEVCPVEAIGEDRLKFFHQKCFEKLKSFQKNGLVGHYICGICVKVCKGNSPT